MWKYFRILLIISLIGGGFACLCEILKAIPLLHPDLITCLGVGFAFIINIMGIYAGFKIIAGSDLGLRLAKIFFLVQIPMFSNMFFLYQFICGFMFSVGLNLTERQADYAIQPGAYFFFSPHPKGDLEIYSINLFALFMLWSLSKIKTLKTTSKATKKPA